MEINYILEILDRAAAAIKTRGPVHGNYDKQMFIAAMLWSAYLGHTVTKKDVPIMLNLLKISRIRQGDSLTIDHYVDGCGYLAMAGGMAINDQEEKLTQNDELQKAQRPADRFPENYIHKVGDKS